MDFASRQRQPTRHLVGFGAVVLVHAVLGYALVNGLARRVVEIIKQPLETRIIDEVKPPPPETAPPPPIPKLALPPPSFVPPPEVAVATPPAAAPQISTTQVAPPPSQVSLAPAGPASSAGAVRVAPQVNFNRDCQRPDYPAAAARAEATGVVVIAAYVDLNGRVTQSRIERSSGATREHKQLDQAALQAITATCKFKPGTVDGKPEPLWTQVQYVWTLD
ncbi:energy transducer TonB [Ideonella sp. BN130291]|uniref:energy transducer TonB n=1 Tax=Ideonella sp. BN130291 TaxID=3112940 RepID=UPI002E268AB9|nr:TonB family protein [Ideonella sp. BN130291]